MKKINNFILSITTISILSFAFYSCSNESEAEIISKDFKSREIFINPQENFGIQHNEILENSFFYSEENLDGIIENINNYTSSNVVSINELEKVGYNFTEKTFTFDKKSLINSGLSTNAQDFAFEFITSISSKQDIITFQQAIDYAKAKEIEVNDSNFSHYDKEHLFKMIATFKNSSDFWYKYDQSPPENTIYKRKLGWLRWVAAALVDTAAAIITAPATPAVQIGVTVAASGAVLLVDTVKIGWEVSTH
ncbi:hypothetical protein EG240_08480 [Paenimyroides tangerinum]|uniref:Uncharacterized protein n=1 Tax=Paenimyroides tangerinum TaxID=2488728 RepID=A0A3P3WDC4_9FLAO|nr:hypothetical protein [Paenimyroides tangerinum]RRJ90553.1 hypothetical protein EG240_08480 [Paenimyroides tangerinum]